MISAIAKTCSGSTTLPLPILKAARVALMTWTASILPQPDHPWRGVAEMSASPASTTGGRRSRPARDGVDHRRGCASRPRGGSTDSRPWRGERPRRPAVALVADQAGCCRRKATPRRLTASAQGGAQRSSRSAVISDRARAEHRRSLATAARESIVPGTRRARELLAVRTTSYSAPPAGAPQRVFDPSRLARSARTGRVMFLLVLGTAFFRVIALRQVRRSA